MVILTSKNVSEYQRSAQEHGDETPEVVTKWLKSSKFSQGQFCPNQDLHLFDLMWFFIILQSAEIRSHPVTVLSSRIWSVAYQRPFLQRQRYQENHAAFWSPTQTWIGQTPSQWAGFGKCSSKLVKRKWKAFCLQRQLFNKLLLILISKLQKLPGNSLDWADAF